MLRLFIAIELDAEVTDELARCQVRLRERLPVSVAWVKRSSMHLTLQFLGEVEADRVDTIVANLAQVVTPLPSFTLRLASLDAFPSLARPRALWIGIQGQTPELMVLRQVVDGAMAALRFPSEGQFQPHLTLGRVRDNQPRSGATAVPPGAAGAIRPLPIQVGAVSLMRTQLTPGGSVYTRLSAFPLAP